MPNVLKALAILSSVTLLDAGTRWHARMSHSQRRCRLVPRVRDGQGPASSAPTRSPTPQERAAQSTADKLRAGTFAGPAATVVTSAQLEQLLVEMRRAREASDKLLAETKKAARAAALRFGIEHSEDDEFAFNYRGGGAPLTFAP